MRWLMFIASFLLLSSFSRAELPEDILINLNSDNEEERLDTCLLLGKLGNPEAVPYLKERLKDNSMLVRHSAANALARIGGEEVNNIFKELISGNNTEKKRVGLAGLAMTGDPASIETVIGELDNPDWQVRWSAVYALGQWGYRPVLQKLSGIAENDTYQDKVTGEYPVRKLAENTCKKILCSIEWYRNLKDAKVLSEKLSKPVWIYWYIEENNLCGNMEETLFSSEISDISQGFVCLKLDAVKNGEAVSRYNINAVPCAVISDKDDNEIYRILGLISREELISRLKKALENKGTPKQWRELTAVNPGDAESSWHLAEWYLDSGRIEEAVPLLENVIKYDERNQSGYTDNALFVLGYSLGALGKHKKAVELLDALRKKYPDFKDMDKALYCLGLDYLSLNKPESARKVFNELVEVYPESKTIKPVKEILEKL